MDGRTTLARMGWQVIGMNTDWTGGYVLIEWDGRRYVVVAACTLDLPETNARLLSLARDLEQAD